MPFDGKVLCHVCVPNTTITTTIRVPSTMQTDMVLRDEHEPHGAPHVIVVAESIIVSLAQGNDSNDGPHV